MTLPALQLAEQTSTVDPPDIHLQCPQCRAAMDQEARCLGCAFEIEEHDGVFHALPAGRAAHYERFIGTYERIRSAEGRGSDNDSFYLALPYQDLSGKNNKAWQIRARSFDFLLGRILRPALKENAKILDLGAGNCWMSFRLALAGYKPAAVDLLTNKSDGLGAADHYRGSLPTMFPRFQAEMARLPFADEQFDAIVFNASFHYVEDAQAAVREALRCVRAGGLVILCDTPWYTREASGRQMVEERRAAFLRTYGTASDSIESVEFLTTDRLRALEQRLSIRWTAHSPYYGFQWAMRPVIARLRRKREPSRFRIYVARKNA
jgi:SAM-dependent methyltransferase